LILARKLLTIALGLLILTGCSAPLPAPARPTQAPPIAATPSTAPSPAAPEATLQRQENTQPAPTAPALTQPPPVPPAITALPGPDCAIGLPPTRADMEGPYFLAGSPEKASLIEPGMSGTPLTISGYVLTVDCKWVPGTKLEFWQADANGEYDLQGYRLRGHVFTDENGRYQIETILPAPYESRPRHIHVMVLPPGQPGLTTQLYFPGDSPYPELTVALVENAQGARGEFNFVLDLK
jgi:protocatechuate 3,4-dioxygenase beta subunit